MAKEMRSMVAAADVTPLIDRGAEVDVELKNLSLEDKGIKARLGSVTAEAIQEGETSIRLTGTTASAVVSAVDKFEINTNAEDFGKVRIAVDLGFLDGVVEKNKQLAVPQADIEKAAEILKKAGINAMIAESFAIVGNEFKKSLASGVSSEQGKAASVLNKCVEKTVSYRVKYEKAIKQ